MAGNDQVQKVCNRPAAGELSFVFVANGQGIATMMAVKTIKMAASRL
jgi:hypothetical protein